jgi:hypothetical protein
MIVDCGGGTVDLTTRKLTGKKRLGEITERIGDFCGSTFIDREFIKFLREILGIRAMDNLIENNFDQFQRLVQKFSRRVKIPFAEDHTGFHYELDIEENAPSLLRYVSKETKKIMEDNEWVVDIKYDDIKKWFDPIVERIINMIHIQLSNNQTCSAMFLVGGFSENRYLQKRIKKEFQHQVKTISVPTDPVAAVVRGAALYGLSIKYSSNADRMSSLKTLVISTRTLKFTYGIKILSKWKKEEHPLDRKIHDDRIYLFETFVKRGTEVEVDQEFISKGYTPLNPKQDALTFELLKSPEYNVKYHNEPGVEPVGKLRILLPGANVKSRVTFGFSLGQMEITAFAKNELDGQNFQIKFQIYKDL